MWARFVKDLVTLSLRMKGHRNCSGHTGCMDRMDFSEWMRISMYGRDPSSEGHSMVNCRSSVKDFRKLRNPSACDLSSKYPIRLQKGVCW